MIALTANRLDDGRVVYLAQDGAWTHDLTLAVAFDDEDSALEAIVDGASVVGVYSIAIENQAPAGAKHLRERIRRDGPTAGSTHLMALGDDG